VRFQFYLKKLLCNILYPMRFLRIPIALILCFMLGASAFGQNTVCLPANGDPRELYNSLLVPFIEDGYSLDISGSAGSIFHQANCGCGCNILRPVMPQQDTTLHEHATLKSSPPGFDITVSTPGTYTFDFVYIQQCGGGCCSGPQPANYTETWIILPALSPTISGNLNICDGQSTTLTVNCGGDCAGATYTWNQGLGSGQAKTVTPPIGTHTYTVTVTRPGQDCEAVTSIDVTVSPAPAINPTATPTAICVGDAVSLEANCPLCTNFTWSNGLGTGANVLATPASTTNYTVTGTQGGCSVTATVPVTVNQAPVFTIIGNPSMTICQGGTTVLEADCSANCPGGGTGYQWSNGLGTGFTKSVTPAVNTTYSLTATSPNGCVGVVSKEVTVTALPSVNINPATPSICSGGNAALTATGATTYSWSEGSNTAAINVSPASTTSYTVTGTTNGCTNTATVTVTVSGSITPVFTNASPSFCAGNNTVLSLTQGYNAYNWSSGATTPTITVSTAGTYSVTVTDAGGCTGTGSVSVTTVAAPSVSVSASANPICNGSSTVITATGTSPYLWSNGATTSSITVSPNTNTTYSVTSGSGACTATANVSITVNPLPSVIVTTSSTICSGESITLGASGATTYSWSQGGNTVSINVSPASTTTYTVTGTSAGCSNTATTTVTVNAAPTPTLSNASINLCTGQSGSATLTSGYASYLWLDPSSGNQNTAAMSISTGMGSGLFAVTVTAANGCTGTTTGGFTRSAGLAPAFTPASTAGFCAGGTHTLALTSGYTGYQWSTGATTATINVTVGGTYTVTVTNGGCSGSVSASVSAFSLPVITMTAGAGTTFINKVGQTFNFTACVLSPVTVNASASGGQSPYSYSWDNGNTSAALSANVPDTAMLYPFALTVTDANGCIRTSLLSLEGVGCANPVLNASASTICSGNNVVLTVTNLPTNPRVFWSTGDSLTSTIVRTPVVTTTYSVNIYSGATFVGSDTVTVTVVPSVLTLATDKTTLCSGDSARLTTNIGVNCPTCVVNYFNGFGTNIGNRTGLPDTTIGRMVSSGLYYAQFANCNTVSNIISIGQSNINASITYLPDTILCGSADATTLIANGSCTSCSYAWSRNGVLQVGNSNIFTATQGGSYGVTITDQSNNCSSVRNQVVTAVTNRILSFNLPSPLSISGGSQDLTTYINVTPPYPGTSTFAGSGVSGNNFSPALAGVGNHFVTYSYTDSGCIFSIVDTIQVVSNSSSAIFTNINAVGADSVYANSEACVGDTLAVTISNYNFSPLQIQFSNGQGGFIAAINVLNSNVAVDGNGKYNGSFFVVVPSTAKTGTMRLLNGATTANLGAIVVNNPDLAFIGLSFPSCSSTDYPLTGLPAGGTFTASYTPVYAPVAALINANTFMASAVTGYTAGARNVQVRYTFVPSYGNGTGGACPAIFRDTITNVLDVALDTITFFPIAVSETNVSIDSVRNQVLPVGALAYPRTFSGSFVTLNSGNYFFQPNLAGVGTHPITLNISNGACTNSTTGVINVLPAPDLIGLNAQYCDIAGIDTILRDPAFAYSNTTTPALITYVNEITVSATNYSGSFTPQCSATPAAQCYLFNPALVTGGTTILTVLYRRRMEFYTGGVLTSTQSYIVGRSVDTIIIGSGSNVDILSTDTLYCAGSGFRQIQLSPNTGSFSVVQLNGTTPNATKFTTSVSNGTAVINVDNLYLGENTNVYYKMYYTFGAAGCSNTDSLTFVIPQPANANFATVLNNTGNYCRLDIADTLNALVLPQNRANTSLFTINNIPAIDRVFNPNDNSKVFIGTNIITHSIANNFGCVSLIRDTFIVNPMPVITFAAPANRYCVYDNSVTVQGNSNPSTGSGTLFMQGNITPRQSIANPYTLSPSGVLGASIVSDTIRFTYVHTDGNGCRDSNTVSTILNPRPVISLAPLQPRYCQDPALIVNLTPNPAGGVISTQLLTGTVSNVNIANGTYIPNQSTREAVIYNYTSPITSCNNTYRDTVEVDAASTTILGINIPSSSFCFVGDTIQIVGTRQPANAVGTPTFYTNANTPNGGIVRMNGDTAWFVPNQAQSGDVIITYSITTATCSKITQTTVNIKPLPNLTSTFSPAAAALYPPIQRQLQGDSTICDYSRAVFYVFDGNRPPAFSLLQPTDFTYTGIGYYIENNVINFITDSIPSNIRINSHPINISYTDANGCSANLVDSIRVLPNMIPSIVGLGSAYCLGGAPDTIFGLPVNGTWSHTPTSPSIINMFPNPGVVSAYAVVYPNIVGNASVTYRVTSANSCYNVRTENISVNPGLAIQINAPTSVCSNSPLFPISATNATTNQGISDVVTFYFSRAGVLTPAAFVNDTMFNSSIGPSIGNTDTIFAYYSDTQSGCSDTTFQGIIINPAPDATITFNGAAGVGANVYCIDNNSGSTVNITGGNAIGALTLGGFSSAANRLVSSTNTSAVMLIDSILVDTITFIATSGACADTISRAVEIRGLPTGLAIAGLDSIYCQNTSSIIISGFPTPSPSLGITGELSIRQLATNNIVQTSSSNTLSLSDLPNSVGAVGAYEVNYRFTNEFGCINNVIGNFELHPNPVAQFNQTGFCAGDTLVLTDASFFNTIYNSRDQINRWIWNYNSQTAPDTSTVFFPSQIPNTYPARLTVVSDAGCSNSLLELVNIYRYPTVGFEAVGGCQGINIEFLADSTNLLIPSDSITFGGWDFGDGNTDNINTIISTFSQIRPSAHTYTQEGIYYPKLTITNRGLCTQVDSVRLIISPRVALQTVTLNPPFANIITNSPYLGNFEQGQDGWFPAQDNTMSDWNWGWAGTNGGSENINTRTPNDEHQRVWTTSIGVSGADSSTTFPNFVGDAPTWVYSPCFDFTYSQRPMIKLDYLSDMRAIVDGAALEYYDTRIDAATNKPLGWRRLGDIDNGINWYNSNNLIGLFTLPNQREYNILQGWSDTVTDWTTARYRLDQFRGKNNVQFRIAFSAAVPNNTGGVTGRPFNGFAFDNVWLGERGRNVLIEHFANVGYNNMQAINQHVYDLAFDDYNFQDIALIQYHTGKSGPDPYYTTITAANGASARILKYGISNLGDGRAAVDGNYWLGLSQQLTPQILDHQMLQDPTFSIEGNNEPKITLNIGTQSATIEANITALQDLPLGQYTVYPTIVEDSIMTTTIGEIRSVFRTFLPNSTGVRYVRSWQTGDNVQISETWTYNIGDIVPAKLKGVVFIQDSLSEVYHAVTTLNFDVRIVGVEQENAFQESASAFSLNLFPNPAADQATMQFDAPLAKDFNYQLFDMRGVQIQKGIVSSGSQQHQIDLYDLPAGVYIVSLFDDAQTVRVQRKLVVNKP
jgi:hypothetical protein